VVFLDANLVIYIVERPPIWGQKATMRLATFRAAAEQLAVTELVRMECLVGPIKVGDTARRADFAAFFSAPDVHRLPITAAVAERAAEIRGTYSFQPLDSLHLAAAVIHSCTLFWTNDSTLKKFPDIPIEILT